MDVVRRSATSLDFVEAYAAASARVVDSITSTDLRAPVPTCSPWSAYDLVVHLGNVHAWAATIVETGHTAPQQNDEPRTGRAKNVSAWYAAKAEDLYQVLRYADPDAPCWNFVTGAGVAEFWPRRQLHETTIHLLDLDRVAGRRTPVEGEVAVDGVGEVLSVMMDRMVRRGHPARLERPLALTATDTADTWVLTPSSDPTAQVPAQSSGPGSLSPTLPAVEHARSPVVGVEDRLEGTAETLYRLLWHRDVEPGTVRTSGDASLIDAFLGSRLTP